MDYQHIFTDGSKDKERVGCAVLRENDHQTMRIPDGSSVFSAEAKAIDLALDLVDSGNSHDKFIILSYSLSVLQALNHTSSKKPTDPRHFAKTSYNFKIKNCWILSHIGIRNNERVDKKAKESLNLEQTVFKIPFNNFKPFINRYIFDKWQTSWNETHFNKQKEIKPIIKESKSVI